MPQTPPFNPGEDVLYTLDPRGLIYRVQSPVVWRQHTIPGLGRWIVRAVATGPGGRGFQVTGRAEHFTHATG